jgi:hypothetical protein
LASAFFITALSLLSARRLKNPGTGPRLEFIIAPVSAPDRKNGLGETVRNISKRFVFLESITKRG